MSKIRELAVPRNHIRVLNQYGENYVCLTDIAVRKNSFAKDDVVKNRFRSRKLKA